MADTLVASSLTPASNKAGQSTAVRLFKVSDIPGAMDKMKWPVAAALMRHWFTVLPGAMPAVEWKQKRKSAHDQCLTSTSKKISSR